MRTLLLAGMAWCVCLSAQSPTDVFDKAPPETDKALRARVSAFFQAHVEGKFRQAEAVVAEDSKDAYYNSTKRRYLGFEIVKVQYSDNFSKANVITAVEMDWSTSRLGKIRVKPPLKTQWKLENGEWFWYVVPQKDWETPFGRMKPGADPVAGAKPKWAVPDAETMFSQVKVNKGEIRLASHEKSEDSAEIVNGMPGEITIKVDQPSPATGLQVKVDKELLKSGETARVLFEYTPPDRTPKATLETAVTINPTGMTVPFRITFSVPPEYEKYLPKSAPAAPKQ
jgi:hypothetical protein